MKKFPRITLDPHIQGHRPSVRGIRIRVTDTPEMLDPGATQVA